MREDLNIAAAEALIAAAAQIPPGTEPGHVRELVGDPIVVSKLANGGESWLYVRADPQAGQLESLSLAFDADGRFSGLDRKPLD